MDVGLGDPHPIIHVELDLDLGFCLVEPEEGFPRGIGGHGWDFLVTSEGGFEELLRIGHARIDDDGEENCHGSEDLAHV